MKIKSKIWLRYINDIKKGSFRSYASNQNFGTKDISRYIFYYKIIILVERLFLGILRRINNLFIFFTSLFKKLLSKIIFKNSNFAIDIGISKIQNTNIRFEYSEDFEIHQKLLSQNKKFRNFYKSLKINYSYNNFKLCYYYYILRENVDLKKINYILEIGAGFLNFFEIFASLKKEKFSYVVVDFEEFNKRNLDNLQNNSEKLSGDLKTYTFKEISRFKIDTKPKVKLLFLTPKEFFKINIKFDILINHESFGEMNINTVNTYINNLKNKKKDPFFFYSVNRFSRKLDNNYTCFCDYELKEFKTKLFKLDEFRNLIPGAESNVIYLGKSSKKN